MKTVLSILIFLCTYISFAQKRINIITTNNVSSTDQKIIEDLIKRLKSEKKFKDSRIYLRNILNPDEDYYLITRGVLENLTAEFPNKQFKDKNIEVDQIKSNINSKNIYEYISTTNPLNLNFENQFFDFNLLIKGLKKENESIVTIVYNNGYSFYHYSKENILSILKGVNSQNRLTQITPLIISPSKSEKDLRPDGSHYYISFNSEDVFPTYQIDIYLKYYVNSQFDSVLIVKECLNMVDLLNFQNNKEKFDIVLIKGFDNNYKVAIKETYIVEQFYKKGTRYLNTSQVPDDEACGECIYEQLYRQMFSLNIKGCGVEIPANLIPIGFMNTGTEFFLFQCSNKQK